MPTPTKKKAVVPPPTAEGTKESTSANAATAIAPASPVAEAIMGSPETRILRSGKKQKRRRSRENDGGGDHNKMDTDDDDGGDDVKQKDQGVGSVTKRAKLFDDDDKNEEEKGACETKKIAAEDVKMQDATSSTTGEAAAAASATSADTNMGVATGGTAPPTTSTRNVPADVIPGTATATATTGGGNVSATHATGTTTEKAAVAPVVESRSTTTITKAVSTTVQHLTGEKEVISKVSQTVLRAETTKNQGNVVTASTTEEEASGSTPTRRSQLFQSLAGLYSTPAREGILSSFRRSPAQQPGERTDTEGTGPGSENVVSLLQPRSEKDSSSSTAHEEKDEAVAHAEDVAEEPAMPTTTSPFVSKKGLYIVVAFLCMFVALPITYHFTIQPLSTSMFRPTRTDENISGVAITEDAPVQEEEEEGVAEKVNDTILKSEPEDEDKELYTASDDDDEEEDDTESEVQQNGEMDRLRASMEQNLASLDELNDDMGQRVSTPASTIPGKKDSQSGDDIIPAETDVVPIETDIVPKDNDTVPTETDTVPTETDTVPTETDTVPTETDTVPTETDTVPTETDIVPTETDIVPTETDNVPTESESESETGETVAAMDNEEEEKETAIPEAEPTMPTLTQEEAEGIAKERLMNVALQKQKEKDEQSLEGVQTMMKRVREELSEDVAPENKEEFVHDVPCEGIDEVLSEMEEEEAELVKAEESMMEAKEALEALLSTLEVDDEVLNPSDMSLPSNTPDCNVDEDVKLLDTNDDDTTEDADDNNEDLSSSYLKRDELDAASVAFKEWTANAVANRQLLLSEGSLSSIQLWLQAEYNSIKTRVLSALSAKTEQAEANDELTSLGEQPREYKLPESILDKKNNPRNQEEIVTKDEVKTVMSNKLRKMMADNGSDQLNFASLRHGASVVHQKTSPSFVDTLPPISRLMHYVGVRFYGHPPEQALSKVYPPGSPGQCWAFRSPSTAPTNQRRDDSNFSLTSNHQMPLVGDKVDGKYATLTVKLAEPTQVMSVAVEHPKSTVKESGTNKTKDLTKSAIQQFRVYGHIDPDADDDNPFFLGEFVFDIHRDSPYLQVFNVTSSRDGSYKKYRAHPAFGSVTLAIDSVWGNDYACLYGFRVFSSSS